MDNSARKLLTDNRDRYIQQSSNTRAGHVGVLPPRGFRLTIIQPRLAPMHKRIGWWFRSWF